MQPLPLYLQPTGVSLSVASSSFSAIRDLQSVCLSLHVGHCCILGWHSLHRMWPFLQEKMGPHLGISRQTGHSIHSSCSAFLFLACSACPTGCCSLPWGCSAGRA